MSKEVANHDLKPMAMEEAMKVQESVKTAAVIVERADGKQITVATKSLAHHLERGFKFVGEVADPKPEAEEKPKKAPKEKPEAAE